MTLSYRSANRIAFINRIPLLNRILRIDIKRSADKDKDYWKNEAYSNKTYPLKIKVAGRPVASIPYRIGVGDIFLSNKRDKFFSLLVEMMDKGLIPEINGKCRVFEPGCNVGAVLRRLQYEFNCEVYGMDISVEAIKFAKGRLFRSNKRATFFTGDVLDHAFFRQFADNYFDLSVSVSHLVHVENCEEKARYIGELIRISKSVVFFERIKSGDSDNVQRNFEDYETKYGFSLFRKIEKKKGKQIGMYYHTKERIG